MQQSKFSIHGVRETEFSITEGTASDIKKDWESFAKLVRPYPENTFAGRGIVICAGGVKYLTCAWVAISNLRAVGCKLPIELWYTTGELTNPVIKDLERLNVDCIDLWVEDKTTLKGASSKPLAILNSKFQEILYLDADNICVSDPTYLFDFPKYRQFGCIFWTDHWKTSSSNPIWQIIGKKGRDILELDTGQIIVDKRTCWQALNLCTYFNVRENIYPKVLQGCKDTFTFAWLALNKPYYVIDYAPGICGYSENGDFNGITNVHYGPDGNIIFLHRHLAKWAIEKNNVKRWVQIKRFKPHAESKLYYLKFYSGDQFSIDIEGETETADFCQFNDKIEEQCQQILQDLSEKDSFKDFMQRSLLDAIP